MIKPPITIKQQIELLKSRGMRFRDISKAPHFLENISYYRLKGYWWEMQTDKVSHFFSSDSYFEDAVQAYNFDRRFRLIIFNGIERIEIALRTKLIYHMSLNHGVHWYLDHHYFNRTDAHLIFLSKMFRDICNSSEEFIIKHKNNHKNDYPESWKALEIITLGTLSKLYKNIYHQLPEKATIANEFGLNNQSYLASWLLSITLVRNIIAHHSRLWNRTVINKYDWPKSTPYPLLTYTPNERARGQIFPLFCAIIYLNDRVSPGHHIRDEFLHLLQSFPNIPLYKMGFPRKWQNQPIWNNK